VAASRKRATAKDTKPRSAAGWFIYVLRCADDTLYTGATNDLERRLARHLSGKGAAYTRSRLPVTLVYSEPAADRGAALRREAAIKRLPRAEKLVLVAGAVEFEVAAVPRLRAAGRARKTAAAGD
jgi:putative endonuclease